MPLNRPPRQATRHLERALPNGSTEVELVRLTQAGEMFREPGGRALPFRATEEIRVAEIAFEWRARIRIAPLVSAAVVDRYADGSGSLSARMLGLIPMMGARGPDIDRGEAMRYLSELPWAPHAIDRNHELRWRQLGPHSLEVGTLVNGSPVAVRLDSNTDGDMVRALGDRPRQVGKEVIETPWISEFADYETVGEVRVPTRAEVSWLVDEGPFTYWRGKITGLETE